MKKIFLLLICLQIFTMQNSYSMALEYIRDDFAEETLGQYKNKSYKANNAPIEDALLDRNFYSKVKKFEKKPTEPILDTFAASSLKGKNLAKLEANLDYDYTCIDRIFFKLKATSYTTTKDRGLQEGNSLHFYTLSDVDLPHGEKIPKNTKITARVETISKNGAMGVPADIVISNFKVKGDEKNPEMNLVGTIEKTGANRSLWVYPLGYAFTPFFGAGLFVFAVRGGHAKIKPNQVYTVYYGQ